MFRELTISFLSNLFVTDADNFQVKLLNGLGLIKVNIKSLMIGVNDKQMCSMCFNLVIFMCGPINHSIAF